MVAGAVATTPGGDGVDESTPPKGRETIYKGIRFKSRLEADFAGFLDRIPAEWKYEPVCFAADRAGGQIQYLPDFWVLEGGKTTDGDGWVGDTYIEVKPTSFPLADDQGRAELYPLLNRMTVIWDTIPGATLRLILWSYGGQYPHTVVSAKGDDHVWYVSCTQFPSMKLLLPGMGQWAAIADRYFDTLRKVGAVGG